MQNKTRAYTPQPSNRDHGGNSEAWGKHLAPELDYNAGITREEVPRRSRYSHRQVGLSRIERITTCYLTIQFEEEPYLETLLCKDATFCRQLCGLLQNHIAKPIKEIGDLDLFHTL